MAEYLGMSAGIVEHSVNEHGEKIATFQLRYQRFIHAEVMTHRVFSRNASSSRAIPVLKLIAQAIKDTAIPFYWGSNKPGMQAGEELTGYKYLAARFWWFVGAHAAAFVARRLNGLGVHKQIANRVTEPYQWISVVLTSTEWDNWFELRDHEDAQPEIAILAKLMRQELELSEPTLRRSDADGEEAWHLPYITDVERREHHREPEFLAKLSTARCARVSYLTHDGLTPDQKKDLHLYERLVGSEPLHASPTEHPAKALGQKNIRVKNFTGWQQHRVLVESRYKKWRSK